MLYLIMPDRFANGNPKTIAMLLQRKKIQSRFTRRKTRRRHSRDNKNYISSLGATAIWSTPLCEDNDKAYSYHTYAQSDVYKLTPLRNK
jgi:glycosidase